jgi:hypothetical protein
MTEPSRNPRRWRQFTFAQLLAFVALVGCMLAYPSATTTPYRTGRSLDLAVFGRGYFVLMDPATGSYRYTRHGHLTLNANGDLVYVWLNDELPLEPQITLPPDWVDLEVGRSGLLSVRQAGNALHSILGQMQLASFINEEGLRETEPGLYEETDRSGPARITEPGSNGAGVVLQGWLHGTMGWYQALTGQLAQVLIQAATLVTLAWLALEIRRLRRSLPCTDHGSTSVPECLKSR